MEGSNTGSNPHPTRPRPRTHHSSSVPTTPRQHARDFYNERTPSPGTGIGTNSPRSVSSEHPSHMASMKSTSTTLPNCRYQSTKTARRRMPYDSSDPLPAETQKPRAFMSTVEEKKLDEEILTLYRDSLPSHQSQQRREEAAAKIRKILETEYPGKQIQVSVFGSSGNLLNTESSDVDICVTMKDLKYVCNLADLLARSGMKQVTCVHAKGVPIVKIWDPDLQVSCDLNVNNHLALTNTRLVKAYMEIDERARMLAMIVKFWSKRRILNEASGGGLSSYTWTLLVINYLQTRKPPVLPVIELKDSDGNTKVDFEDDAERLRRFGAANEQTVGALVFHFFRRFAHEIDYETSVVSVRTGKLLTKAEKGWDNLISQRLCCEEPFNTQRNLANTADEFSFHGIHLELRQAFQRILEGQSFQNGVCEQFVFPAHEFKHLFERPPPVPKPILTRSASQSGPSRGGRYGSARGARARGDPRNGGNNRRASSASVFGQEMPTYFINPQLVPQPPFFPQLPTTLSMERQSQQISAEIDNLMRREQQLAWFTQNASRLAALDLDRLPVSTSTLGQQRNTKGDKLNSASHTPTSAPLYAQFPRSTPFESPTAMSYSSSQQGSQTNPSSPMLNNAAPLRRNVARTPAPESPGTSHRSQSQPARSYFQPYPYTIVPPGYVVPQVYPTRQGQQAIPLMRPGALYPPYGMAQPLPGYGLPIFQHDMDGQPREYVGYGVAARQPPMSPGSLGQDLRQIPAWEDLQRQGRPQSPTRRSPMMQPSSYGEMSSEFESPTDSTVPTFSETGDDYSSSLADSVIISESQQRPIAMSAPETRNPMIVNGSFSSPNLLHLARQGPPRTADLPEFTNRTDVQQAEQKGRSASGSSGLEINVKTSTNKQEKTEEVQSPARKMRKSSPSTPVSTTRSSVPPLDIGAPADRLRENTIAALSPVQEANSPTPVSPRRLPDSRPPPIVNGSGSGAGSGPGSNGTMHPSAPPATSAWKRHSIATTREVTGPPRGKENEPGSAANANAMARSSMPPPPVPTQSNEWQQAVRKGHKKKSSSKSGGQPMPENVAERKGG